MGIFEILFVAMNVALPAWLWTRSTVDKSHTDWPVWEKNVARIIESDEGFPPCPTLKVVDILRDLCLKSQDRFKAAQPALTEGASKSVVFSCEYHQDGITVGWRLENTSGNLECGDPGGSLIEHSPTFDFNSDGRMKSIGFWGQDNSRQSVPYRNCRTKAATVKTIRQPPRELNGFLERIGHTAKDPADYMTANLFCLTYDSSALWKPWRQKYLK
jgi:hypothetical protein